MNVNEEVALDEIARAHAYIEELKAERNRLRDEAENLLWALLPLLPLNGSGGPADGEYKISERIDPVLAATPEEWATAAHHWLETAKALADERGAE